MEGEKVKSGDFLSLNKKFIFYNNCYSTSVCVRYELAIVISYPTSASRIIVLLKNANKILRILPDFIYKNNRF